MELCTIGQTVTNLAHFASHLGRAAQSRSATIPLCPCVYVTRARIVSSR
jgi:hypothetical protein